MNFSTCLIVPCYNHSAEFEKFLPQLLAHAGTIKIFLIDDGSVPAEAQRLQKLAGTQKTIELVRLEKNGGKGIALKKGFEIALAQNFTHALQIDADGQHDPAEIKNFFQLAQKFQKKCIFGAPVYDENAPKARVYGRKITNFWLALETFSLKMKDGLCGFRLYPLAAVKPLLRERFWSKRMGADIQILVELYWRGNDIVFHNINVIYPEGGRSHLTPFKGNLAISLTHTALVLRKIGRLLLLK